MNPGSRVRQAQVTLDGGQPSRHNGGMLPRVMSPLVRLCVVVGLACCSLTPSARAWAQGAVGDDAPSAAPGAVPPGQAAPLPPPGPVPPSGEMLPGPPTAAPICFMGRSLAECQSNPLLEIGFAPWTQEDGPFVITMDVGWLVNTTERQGVGATIGMLCNQECGFAVKARYRYYLTSYLGLDISPGVYMGPTRGYNLEGALQFSDIVAVTAGVTSNSREDGLTGDGLVYLGFRVGLPVIAIALSR